MVKTIKHPFTGKPLEIKGDQKQGSFWTEARVIELVQMWANGVSSRRISIMMSEKYKHHVTRNAVIGRLSRMGLTSKARQSEKRFEAKQRQRKRMERAARTREDKARATMKHPRQMSAWPVHHGPPHPPLKYEEVFREVIVPEDKRKGLVDLEDYDCRWPIGHPRDADFHFCAARKMPGSSYCAYHEAASAGTYDGVTAPWPTKELKTKKKELEPA